MSRRKQSRTCPARSPRSPVDVLEWQRLILKSDLTAAEKCCAVALGTFVNNDSGLAWPSMATLGEAAGLSEQTARRAVHRLAALGFVSILERSGRCNYFRLGLGAETPICDDPEPLSGQIAELTKEPANPPLPPSGGLVVDKSTGKNPAPTPQATRTTPASNPVFPRVRRTRRTEPPFVRAACHCDAPSEYLAPPPPRTDRRAAAAAVGGLRAALGVARE